MNLKQLEIANMASIDKIESFRKSLKPDISAHHDAFFHQHKNNYPYFGFIEVDVFGSQFLMFSCNDDLIAQTFYWFGASTYERMSMKTWVDCCKKANIIYDIGAFTGVYSLAAAIANKQSQIHAFEAVRRTYARLLMNIQVNRLMSRITKVNKAVSDKAGEVIFNQFRGENVLGNGASMLEKGIPITSNDEKVLTVSLDEYIEDGSPAPDLLKIDVEGAEELVLDGMKNLLSKHKPKLLIEVTPNTATVVYKTLFNNGYKVSLINEDSMSLMPFEGKCTRVINLFAE